MFRRCCSAPTTSTSSVQTLVSTLALLDVVKERGIAFSTGSTIGHRISTEIVPNKASRKVAVSASLSVSMTNLSQLIHADDILLNPISAVYFHKHLSRILVLHLAPLRNALRLADRFLLKVSLWRWTSFCEIERATEVAKMIEHIDKRRFKSAAKLFYRKGLLRKCFSSLHHWLKLSIYRRLLVHWLFFKNRLRLLKAAWYNWEHNLLLPLKIAQSFEPRSTSAREEGVSRLANSIRLRLMYSHVRRWATFIAELRFQDYLAWRHTTLQSYLSMWKTFTAHAFATRCCFARFARKEGRGVLAAME